MVLKFYSIDEDQTVKNVTLDHQYNMKSAYDLPIYSNYTGDFKGCLDYIFYETDGLKTVQVKF